jgi:chaperonin cofactor prefoldin
MLLWNQSEEIEKQNNKLAKQYNELKNQLRMEKKMSRVYEFMVNKSGTLQGHELELIDAMKHSLSDGSEGKLDAKFETLMKQKESQSKEIEQLRSTIDELKRNEIKEKENYSQIVDKMSKNFDNLRNSMSNEYNQKLKEMQSSITTSLSEKMKLE